MSEDKTTNWPMAEITGMEEGMLLVEFIDAMGKKRGIAVEVPDEKVWKVGQVVDLSRKDDGVVRKPVKSPKVAIRAEKLYSVHVDGKRIKGLFKERDSMSGMKKLVRVDKERYCELVVDCPDGVMEVLSTVLGTEEDIDVNVVKASPDFIDEMMMSKNEREENE